MGLGTPPNSQQIHNEYYYFCHNEPHNDAPSVSVCQAPRVARQQPHGANLAPRRRATCTCPQPKRAAAPPPRAPAQPELMVGAAMEVQGCGEGCDLLCNTCEWEACALYCRRSHGVTCDVRISTPPTYSHGDLCQGVQRRHLRPAARAVGKRAAAATEPTGGGSHRLKASTRGVCVVFGRMVALIRKGDVVFCTSSLVLFFVMKMCTKTPIFSRFAGERRVMASAS